MIIDADLEVRVGDGLVVFEEPTLRDWAILSDMAGKTMEEQADIIIPKIKEIKNLQYRDGTDVTVDDLRLKKFSAKFFLNLIRAWSQAIVAGFKTEAEEKNAETIN